MIHRNITKEYNNCSRCYKTFLEEIYISPKLWNRELMPEPALKCENKVAIFNLNDPLKLFIFLMYFCCFDFRGNLDFPDFLQKKFYSIEIWSLLLLSQKLTHFRLKVVIVSSSLITKMFQQIHKHLITNRGNLSSAWVEGILLYLIIYVSGLSKPNTHIRLLLIWNYLSLAHREWWTIFFNWVNPD